MQSRPKTPAEHEQDKVRLKQLAVLWWVQKIYELAHQRCLATGAYRYHHGSTPDSLGYNKDYRDVLEKLRAIAIELNGGTTTGLWPPVEAGPPRAQLSTASGSCTSDDQCPEYFICDSGECVPILPDATLA